MEEEQEIFTNPFNIQCESCGAPAVFDIISQNYHCKHCGATTALDQPVAAVARYRRLHVEELKAGRQKDNCRKYNCPHCGAVVVIDSLEATAKCDFCGTQMVNSDFVESDAFPEMMIPFKLTLDEAKEELRKWIKANSSKGEAKNLESRIDELQGYYLPYQIVKGPVSCQVSLARSARKYTCGGYVEEVAVNTSKQMENLLLNAMEPFDWRELRPFEYGFIADMRTKLQDAKAEAIEKRIREEIRDAYLPTIEKTLQTQDLNAVVDRTSVLEMPALLPVYIINRGAVQVAINGQTGRVAVSPLKATVTHRAWLEPVLTVLFVAGLSEVVPLFLNYHPSFEITAGLSIVTALIVWAAYSGTSNVEKRIFLQSAKQLAKRVKDQITFTSGNELIDNPALKPVFFEDIGGKTEAVEISFYSGSRIVKAGIFALLTAFLPNILAWLFVAWDVYINGASPERFAQIHHFYAAAWWTLMIPCLFVLWIAVVRRDVFEYPVLYRILPDGRTEMVENLYQSDIRLSDIIGFMTSSPGCWIVFLFLFLILGCTAAILD